MKYLIKYKNIYNMNNPTVKPKPKVSPTKPSPRRKRIWETKPVVTPKPKM